MQRRSFVAQRLSRALPIATIALGKCHKIFNRLGCFLSKEAKYNFLFLLFAINFDCEINAMGNLGKCPVRIKRNERKVVSVLLRRTQPLFAVLRLFQTTYARGFIRGGYAFSMGTS